MNTIQKIFYFFSSYTTPNERKVGIFFAKLNENSSNKKTFDKLTVLMQQNIVVINLFSEYKYKGYKYLTKNKRNALYQNVDAIESNFNDYLINSPQVSPDDILNHIKHLGIETQNLITHTEKLIYLKYIMDYFSPDNKKYKYRESSTFGELLKNPTSHQLVGDCNQIVTLYIYFYSLKYSISDLQLITYPGHVALHFNGVDIEATNGQFKKYQENNQKILPIQEIISINLLDTTDAYFKTHPVDPELFLQSARLAYLVSSEREIVNKNLTIAYNNTVSELMTSSNYESALKYAKQSGNKLLISSVGHNGAIFYMGKNKFTTAIKFANYADSKKDLTQKIYYNQGITFYNNSEYHKAIKALEKINSIDLIKRCYEGLYMQEQNKMGKVNTVAEIKQKSSKIRKMHAYAKKSENNKLIEYTNSLIKYL